MTPSPATVAWRLMRDRLAVEALAAQLAKPPAEWGSTEIALFTKLKEAK